MFFSNYETLETCRKERKNHENIMSNPEKYFDMFLIKFNFGFETFKKRNFFQESSAASCWRLGKMNDNHVVSNETLRT